MSSRRLRFATALALALAMFASVALVGSTAFGNANASAAQYQRTRLSIARPADFISQGQIIVYVTVRGEGGVGFVSVNVVQARPPLGANFGFGSTNLICDGHPRTYAVTVFGSFFPGWQLGEAEAAANAFCPTSGSDFDTRTIRITKP
jgi:hypothetical protein